MKKEHNWSVLLGSIFNGYFSSGSRFLTQTTVFTQARRSFWFVILLSILLEHWRSANVWRIITVSEKRAQDIANSVLPGLGLFIAILIVIGGLAFNIGNVGGAGLSFNALFGISPKAGAVITAIISIAIFLVKEAGKLMDRFAQLMGGILIVLMVYVAVSSAPPLGEAVSKHFGRITLT